MGMMLRTKIEIKISTTNIYFTKPERTATGLSVCRTNKHRGQLACKPYKGNQIVLQRLALSCGVPARRRRGLSN